MKSKCQIYISRMNTKFHSLTNTEVDFSELLFLRHFYINNTNNNICTKLFFSVNTPLNFRNFSEDFSYPQNSFK